jgi:hypothetical protein
MLRDDQVYFHADEFAVAEAAATRRNEDLYVIYDKRSKNPTARMYVLTLDAVLQMRDSKDWKRLWEWQIVRKAVQKKVKTTLKHVKSVKTPPLFPAPSQEQIEQSTRDVLDSLAYRLRHYVDNGDMSKLKVKFGESRPLKPVYLDEGGDPAGFIQKGPKVISFVIEDFTEDGWIRGAVEDR